MIYYFNNDECKYQDEFNECLETRPYYTYDNGYWALLDEVHLWFISMGIDYEIGYLSDETCFEIYLSNKIHDPIMGNVGDSFIVFLNESDYNLFLLKWI